MLDYDTNTLIRSFGRMYEIPSGALGFNYFQVGSVMGMAAYGSPKYVDHLMEIEELMTRPITPRLELLDNPFFKKISLYGAMRDLVLKEEFYGTNQLSSFIESTLLEINEKDKLSRKKITQLSNLATVAASSGDFPYDVASSVQKIFEDNLVRLVQLALEIKPLKNICFTGGCALNCLAIHRIREDFPDLNIYIPPVPYDAGLCLGAAQYLWHHIFGQEKSAKNYNFSAYMGGQYNLKEIEQSFSEHNHLVKKRAKNEDVIDLLLKQKIIAVFGGKSESGRRALGNRSILADPRNGEMKDRLNYQVKHRHWFRPFAPSILEEEVSSWFENPCVSPYMSTVLKFRPDKGSKVPAVNHPDGTARLQTVSENDNKWYYHFLKIWFEKSGVPIILNTSFNDSEPICETPRDAFLCFNKTKIDYLYFYEFNLLICRKQ